MFVCLCFIFYLHFNPLVAVKGFKSSDGELLIIIQSGMIQDVQPTMSSPLARTLRSNRRTSHAYCRPNTSNASKVVCKVFTPIDIDFGEQKESTSNEIHDNLAHQILCELLQLRHG